MSKPNAIIQNPSAGRKPKCHPPAEMGSRRDFRQYGHLMREAGHHSRRKDTVTRAVTLIWPTANVPLASSAALEAPPPPPPPPDPWDHLPSGDQPPHL